MTLICFSDRTSDEIKASQCVRASSQPHTVTVVCHSRASTFSYHQSGSFTLIFLRYQLVHKHSKCKKLPCQLWLPSYKSKTNGKLTAIASFAVCKLPLGSAAAAGPPLNTKIRATSSGTGLRDRFSTTPMVFHALFRCDPMHFPQILCVNCVDE